MFEKKKPRKWWILVTGWSPKREKLNSLTAIDPRYFNIVINTSPVHVKAKIANSRQA
jgi:hypothetical protein